MNLTSEIMEKRDKKIIIGLVIVIIALVGIALYMFYGQHQSTQIEIMGNGTIEETGSLNIKLSLLNGTGVGNKKINVVIIDKKNKEVLKKSVNTNSKGRASVDLEDISKGNYVVNITFEGDNNYFGNTTSQKIKIIEQKVAETVPETNTESTQQQNEHDINDMNGDGEPEIFYSESYNDDTGLVQYYTTRGGEELVVYEDGSYEYYDSHGNVEGGYI